MANIISNFVTKFHNLDGITIGEKKKNLFKFLRNERCAENEDIATILNGIKTKTYLESLFKIDMLIHYRQTTELLEILKEGNEVFIGKIIKQQWFLQELFSKYTPTEFVNEFFPCLSFATRMKILKRISLFLKEDEMDEIFMSLLKRYGLHIAVTVLQRCSIKKIEEILKDYELILTSGQLKVIYQRSPNLIITYLKEYKNNTKGKFEDKKVLTYIAQQDPTFFWQICDHFDCDVKLGKRTTKKVLSTKKTDVTSNPEKYIKFFHQEKLVRILHQEGGFKQLYQNVFPKNKRGLEATNNQAFQLLKYYPKHGQYFLFTETFQKNLDESIFENVKCLDDSILAELKDEEIREKIAKIKFYETTDAEYIKYYKTENSIPLIKEQIKVTALIDERSKLLNQMIETCMINNDLNALADVLKYFCSRHRNEVASVRERFLTTVAEKFDNRFESFTEHHWKYVNEIVTIQRINRKYCGQHKKMRLKYIEFLYINNKPIAEALELFVKDLENFCYGSFKSLPSLKDPEIGRKLLLMTIDIFPKLRKSNEQNSNDYYFSSAQIVPEIVDYNKKNPKHKISILDNEKLVKFLREICKLDYIQYFVNKSIGHLICKVDRNDLENELLHEYFSHLLPMCPGYKKIIHWYMKYDPIIIGKYMENIIEEDLNYSMVNWHFIRQHTHINLDKIVVEYCEKNLKDERYEEKFKLPKLLSKILSFENYLKITEKNLPKSFKLDTEDEESSKNYKLQCEFVKNLKHFIEPYKILNTVIKYCEDDFLHPSLEALYSGFYRSPENMLNVYVEQLLKKPTSVKKHALFLSCVVFKQENVLCLINKFTNGTNTSMQKHLLKSSIKYFVKNPSDDTYKTVTIFLKVLQKSDIESLKLISAVNIPKKYKHDFIKEAWDIFEKLRETDEVKGSEFDKYQFSLLNTIDKDTIKKLPNIFCIQIVEKYFLKIDDAKCNFSTILPFIFIILSDEDTQIENFRLVFKVLLELKNKHWSNSKNTAFKKSAFNFFNSFYTEAKEEKIKSEFLKNFKLHWEMCFSASETFEEYIVLKCLQLRKETNESQEDFAGKLVVLSQQIINDFGELIFGTFSQILFNFLSVLKPENKVRLYFDMLKNNKTDLICILVLNLLIKEDFSFDNNIKPIFDEMLDTLKNNDSQSVQLHYNLYFKSKIQTSIEIKRLQSGNGHSDVWFV